MRGRLLTGVMVVLAICGLIADPAGATTLIFEPAGPSLSNIDQAYGDHVFAASQGGFLYGNSGEGFTPHVATEYGLGVGTIHRLGTNYGDLENVIYREENDNGNLKVKLTADPGFKTALLGLDLGGFRNADHTITFLHILDENNNVLFSQNNVLVQGDFVGPRHTHFDFTGVSGQALTIDVRIDLGVSDIVALDNIRFSEFVSSPTAVPEPGTFVLLGIGLAGLVGVRSYSRRNLQKA